MENMMEIDIQPMRILQVVTIMNLGGIESMLMTIYRNIDRSRVQFDFIVHREERGIFDDEIESLGGKIYRFLPLSLRNYPQYIKQLNHFFQKYGREYKVIHSHINTNSYNILSVAKKYNLRTRIAHAHIDSVSGHFIKRSLKLFQKPLLRKVATDYFACSKNAAKYLYGSDQDVTLINNAIDSGLYKYEYSKRAEIRHELKIPDRELVIGHVGRFNTQKNHVFILEIFKKLLAKRPDVTLLLVGAGELKDEIEMRIKDLQLGHKIRLLGLRKDVPKILSACDIFLFPSLYEGLSVASVEAQCAGLHVFVSDTISKEGFITEHIYSRALSDTAESWADFILRQIEETPVDREKSYLSIIESGYDIKYNVGFLQDFYSEHYAGKDI